MRPHFHPQLHTLDDRITPTLSFATPQTLGVGTNPQGVAVADFDGDGRPDLVVVNKNDNTVSVLLNATPAGSGSVTFAAQRTFAVGGGPVSVSVGDFDGDGRPDLVTANSSGKTVSVLRNTTELGAPAPSFAAAQDFTVTVSGLPNSVAVGDFNGDGRTDVAIAVLSDAALNENGGVKVLLNGTQVGAPTVTFGGVQSLPSASFAKASAQVASVTVGDFNGDGLTDIAAARSSSNFFAAPPNSVGVYTNATAAGSGMASFSLGAYSTGTTPLSVAAGDFSGDGQPDLAAANSAGNTVSVLANLSTNPKAAATFSAQTAYAVGTKPVAVVAGDFDGDGRADIVAANDTSNTVSVLVNTTATSGAPMFGPQATFAVGTAPAALALGDFNGDGRPDLVAANAGDNTVSVLVNTSLNVAVTGPSLVAQFGTTGVWRFNRVTGAWDQLTAANATSIATAANGNVIAAFGTAGVWYYRPASGWSQLNPNVATGVAIDALGNAVASFPGFGTAQYRLSNGGAFSSPLTSVAASRLAMNARGDLVASFPGYGVWKLAQNAWKQLDTHSAGALAIGANGDVAAVFAGYGVNLFRDSNGWTRVNGVDATSLALDGNGAVVANFPGYGVGKYIRYAGGWQTIAPATQAAGLAADWGGRVFAAFDGYGVWEYSFAYGWQQRRFNTASTFAVG